MNTSRLVAVIGPLVVEHIVGSMAEPDRSVQREKMLELVNQSSDALLSTEVEHTDKFKARFVAETACHLLHGWAGEPDELSARKAVQLAKWIIDESERLCG